MDFGDSPDEAEFRLRLRDVAARTTTPACRPRRPTTSTGPGRRPGTSRSTTPASSACRGRRRSAARACRASTRSSSTRSWPPPARRRGRASATWSQGILEHGSDDIQRRFLPGIVNGRDRWCQGFSEPDAGSDLASLRTRADRDGDEYVITGHKVWTSYSDDADWCLVLARTDHDVPKHKGISAFAVPMHQPGIEQRPLRMINGITKEFGEVLFDGARVPAANMIGEPGEGWRAGHDRGQPRARAGRARLRRPATRKLVKRAHRAGARASPTRYGAEQVRDLGWAIVEAEMLRLHVCRRLSDRLDGISHGPEGSVDKLLMTAAEQAVGHAALAIGGAGHGDGDDTWLKVYLYSRAQSVMGGTSQIQRNLVARRILGLPAS